ncbi:rifin PIR protein, putative [Plasmodium reichenowi]|uniref:Rifin PIR protein, putative n=1 Tax=Plasmodium reichenowi TaxID=5854 RepID=A0A2P9DHG7_PLARE|nr:rifin PIR protein, putative [Plasmodium reichenowi]
MKVHYINILLFAHPLNILVNTHKNASITHHTHTNRSLCECELYAPANYDNDSEMKKVMEIFNKQTQQRLREYDDRMKTTRQKCKDKCDKEIQKIILKDKLEKELMDKFATLQTDIQSDAIPTCVCKKSLADKMEKECLRCGSVLGGCVAPTVGLLGTVAVDQLTSVLTASAMEFATKAGIKAGIKVVIDKIKDIPGFGALSSIDWTKFINGTNYNSIPGLMKAAKDAAASIGKPCTIGSKEIVCNSISYESQTKFGPVVTAANDAVTLKSTTVQEAALGTIKSTTTTSTAAITATVVAIVVIILIMVIIYLILRYRRKKKMKKKLQYIKLLEE